MPTDQRAVCAIINNMFFTTTDTEQRKKQLVSDLNAVRRRLIFIQDKLYALEKNGPVRNITSSMLDELTKLFPWFRIDSNSDANELVIQSVRQPVLFHGNRNSSGVSDNDLVKNREIIYMTLPVYKFEARLQRNGLLRMRQCSARVVELGSDVLREQHVGHPHATLDSRGWFDAICQGNNNFMQMYDRGCREQMSPDTFILVIRKICLWFLEANLHDMYGTSPCGIVNLPDSMTFFYTRSCFDMSSELLAILQKHGSMQDAMHRLHDRVASLAGNVGRDVQDNFLDPLRTYCAASDAPWYPSGYLDAYAFLWASVFHSWASSVRSCAIARDCLMNAVRNDILLLKNMYEDAAPLVYRPFVSPATLLAAPSALLDYGCTWGVGAESMSELGRSLDSGHEWIETRLREWDAFLENWGGTGLDTGTAT